MALMRPEIAAGPIERNFNPPNVSDESVSPDVFASPFFASEFEAAVSGRIENSEMRRISGRQISPVLSAVKKPFQSLKMR